VVKMVMYQWAVRDEDLGDLHRHCYKCFNTILCGGGDDSCPIIRCENGCPFKFHKCKESEHRLLCSRECVQCPNFEYGCDRELQRYQISQHLPKCPANIVACTQEWNRWPVFCQERFKSVPFRRKNPMAKRGDIDLELAMRDQRMVANYAGTPRKTKLALRNNLTRRYPALPLPLKSSRPPSFQDRTIRTLKDIVQFEVSDNSVVGPQYGVAKLFLKQQEIQKRRWHEDVDKAIERTGQPVPKKYWEYEELRKGNVHEHCSTCVFMDCHVKTQADFTSCIIVDCPFNCGFKMHHCKGFEHRMICSGFEEEGEFDWILRDRITRKKKVTASKPLKPFPDLLAGPVASSRVFIGLSRGAVPPAPPLPDSLHRIVQFDISMETVTRLQQKPKAMYTFLCGQDLRRDQWETHCKNVHNDIHGGLNNWMVGRCPLASYGCGFSFNRLYPGGNPGSSVVYSEDTDSFGIRPSQQNIQDSTDAQIGLMDLPVEILQIIFGKLDSWSLSQLSLASRYFREIACSLLDNKGCVALQWERVGDGVYCKRGWAVAYKRWFFSSHFEPVKTWGINVDGSIAEHLKDCPYNDRLTPRVPDKSLRDHKALMDDIKKKTILKRNSEWFIE